MQNQEFIHLENVWKLYGNHHYTQFVLNKKF